MLAGDCMGGTPVETETGDAMAAVGGRRWDQKIHGIHLSRGRRRSPFRLPALPTQSHRLFLLDLSVSRPLPGSRTLGTAGCTAGLGCPCVRGRERQASTDSLMRWLEIDFPLTHYATQPAPCELLGLVKLRPADLSSPGAAFPSVYSVRRLVLAVQFVPAAFQPCCPLLPLVLSVSCLQPAAVTSSFTSLP